MFPQVRMTHAHLPLLLHLLRKNLQCVHFEGHERGLLPVCVVCVYRSTLRRSTRKWVRKPPAAGLRAVEGVGRLLFDMWHQKKNFHYFITFFFIFFLQQVTFQHGNSIKLWFHSSLPAQQVCSFYSPVPNLHSPLTCTVEQENAAACTLCNLRYQRRACLFVWQKRWANSAGYVLTVQCFLSALTAESKVAASPACVHESASLRSVTGDADGCN